jgi:hypothetical protein
MPPITIADPPAADVVASFQQLQPCSKRRPVIAADGSRRPPLYRHHVDDNLYADVREHIPRTIAASIVSLYEILGYPDSRYPDPLSRDKLETEYTHLRKWTGRGVDTRRMKVYLLDYKREQMLQLLRPWTRERTFALLEAAQLHGSLVDIARFSTWGKVLFFPLQNLLRAQLKQRYLVARHFLERRSRLAYYRRQLPPHLAKRAENLVSKDVAALLYRTKTRISSGSALPRALNILYTYLENPTNPWDIPIAYIATRDTHFHTVGDASSHAGGGRCSQLRYWFCVRWSDRVSSALSSSTPPSVDINQLEYIVVLLQLIATVVRLEAPVPPLLADCYPSGYPLYPLQNTEVDNTSGESWAHRLTSKKPRAQPLVEIQAALYRRCDILLTASRITSEANVYGDPISRPDELSDSPADFASFYSQILTRMPEMASWDYFLPSPECLSLLESRLFSDVPLGLPALPRNLGQFVAGGSISCGFSML